jgi:hypothetical protein
MKFTIECDAASFIAGCAYRPPFVELILALDDLILGRSYVGGESKQEILCDALLKADPSRRIPVVPAEQGIDLQAGKSGKFSDLAAGLAG